MGNNLIHRALKMAQMQTGLNMAGSRGFNELFYANACTNVLIWDKLNTMENRKKNPNLNYTEWPHPDQVAALLKLWASGDNRPENG